MVLAVPWGTLFSHPSWLDWVLYKAFSGQHFKMEEAARPLEGWALELTQQQFCHIRLAQLTRPAQILHPLMEVVQYGGHIF